jgi:hypothetical protein
MEKNKINRLPCKLFIYNNYLKVLIIVSAEIKKFLKIDREANLLLKKASSWGT